MKKINVSPDAATGTTTAKQERIEKYKKHDEEVFNHNLKIVMNSFLGENEEAFLKSYVSLVVSLNCKSENDLADAYPDEAKAIFNEKKELVERYAKTYTSLFQFEMNSSGEKRKYFRCVENLVYKIMWLDVCADNKKLLGVSGYDELKLEVDNILPA